MSSNSKWFIEEYRARRSEIELQLVQGQRLINYSLIVLGGIFAFLGAVYEHLEAWICPISFVIALFFLLIAILFERHNLHIIYNAGYIVEVIRENATDLPDNALTWEEYLGRRRLKETGLLTRALLTLPQHSPMLLVALGFFSLGVYGLFWKYPGANKLFSISAGILFAACFLLFAAFAGFVKYVNGEVVRLASQLKKQAKQAS